METVRAAKAFIEEELAKYETWDEWQVSACRDLIRDPSSYGRVRSLGVGIETLHGFHFVFRLDLGCHARNKVILKKGAFMKTGIMSLVIGFLFFTPAVAWDGYDYENGGYVEIEKGNLVRSGQSIEVFDYNTGAYHDVSVESINRLGGSVEVEVFDYNTMGYRTFEMNN